jgi:hypothetical protein
LPWELAGRGVSFSVVAPPLDVLKAEIPSDRVTILRTAS